MPDFRTNSEYSARILKQTLNWCRSCMPFFIYYCFNTESNEFPMNLQTIFLAICIHTNWGKVCQPEPVHRGQMKISNLCTENKAENKTLHLPRQMIFFFTFWSVQIMLVEIDAINFLWGHFIFMKSTTGSEIIKLLRVYTQISLIRLASFDATLNLDQSDGLRFEYYAQKFIL